MANDYELFKGKKLSGLFKDIYDNSRKKKEGINELIADLKKHLKKSSGYAVAIGGVIKDLIDVSVKNDDALVKMAQIAQRLIAAETKTIGEDGFLSERERQQLMDQLKEETDKLEKESDNKIDKIEKEIGKLKENKDE